MQATQRFILALAQTKPESAAESKAEHFGTNLDVSQYSLLITWFLAAFLALSLLRIVFAAQQSLDGKNRRIELDIASVALFVVAMCGFLGHALFVPIASTEKWQPVFDTTTLAWALLAALSFMLPIAQEFSGAGLSFKLQAQEKATSIASTATGLLQTWTAEFNRWLARKRTYNLPAQAAEWLEALRSEYVPYRAYETVQWIGKDAERRRLSVWVLTVDPADPPPWRQRIARFWYSGEFTEAPADFPYLEADGVTIDRHGGILGYVARTQESVNVADAGLHPAYVRRPFSGEFKGLYVTPITRNKGSASPRPLGLLLIDRQKAEKFNPEEVNLLEALAENLSVLMDCDTTF